MDWIGWFFVNIAMAPWNLVQALVQPHLWLDWSDGAAVMRFVYYGGSVEFFFVVLVSLGVLTAVGIWNHRVMWGVVRGLEAFANGIGRFAAWAGLLMVLQQIVIVFVQRIFLEAQIGFGFGVGFTKDISWYAEELKLYNALIVCLCAAYTFVQNGHVRVDLVYSVVGYRAKKMIDMFGSVFFMMTGAVVTWMYAWYFLWRHLITPKVSASDTYVQLVERKARAFRWNVETIGFSPNGFNAYFLFKILLVVFAGMIFLQAVAFLYRSYLELREGEASEGKYLDRDVLGDEQAGPAAQVH